MNILELDSYNLADAVKFNDQLNPRIWQGDKMKPQVRAKLLQIAEDFKQSLGLSDLEVKDITVSGSNAGYTYTPSSDIDLHLVVDLPQADASEVYRELFDAKKFQYNETHNITIGGYDVELYVENANKPPVSQGMYSVVNDDWINIPLKKRATVNDTAVKSKYNVMKHRIESAIASGNFKRLTNTAAKIKKMRQAGLDRHGELGPENLAYKMLRTQGTIKALYDARTAAQDKKLSLKEQPRPRVKYGFAEDASISPYGVSPETKMFLSEVGHESEKLVTDFIHDTANWLGIKELPVIELHSDPEWGEANQSFGRFDPDSHTLHVNLANRHVMDILRTTAHELAHCKQHENADLPPDAGETGSPWENEAHAVAGIVMRHYADRHPELFADAPEITESASGYIPKNKKEARDPRYSMAVTVDIKPGQIGKEANKLGLQTDSQGRPALLMKTANLLESQIAQEFEAFVEHGVAEGQVYEFAPGGNSASSYYAVTSNFVNDFAQQKQEELQDLLDAGWTKQDLAQAGTLQGQAADIAHFEQVRDGFLKGLKPGFDAYLQGDTQLKDQLGAYWQENDLPLDQDWQKIYGEPWGRDEYDESVAEGKSYGYNSTPLSQVPGEREDELGNQEATGPEFPPEMPAGTTKIDVEDLTDWYRLGMDISDMDDADPEDYGKGPPQTVIVFPSDEAEQGYLKQFKRLGLKTHDMDPDVKGGEDVRGKHLNKALAEGKIKLSTDPNWYGAEVGDYKASGPIVNIPANRLVGFEPDDKMNQPASKANVEKIVAGLKQGAKLPPLLIRQYKNGYQVLDGHHRFWAYKLLGVKSIPAQVVPAEDIEEVGKQGVAEDSLASNLLKEYRLFEDDLLEVKMTSKNLAKLAKDIKGVKVGLEFEMIVPNATIEDEDSDMEPDYDQDQRVRDIDDAVSFFDDGDYNSRNELRRLRENMESDFFDWQFEKIDELWNSNDGWNFFTNYLDREDPFDEEEAEEEARNELQAQYGDDITPEEFQTMLNALVEEKSKEYYQEQWDEQGRNYDNAREEFEEEQRDELTEEDWLDSQGIRYASDVESTFGHVTWPYYTSSSDDDETAIERIALDFMNGIGADSVAYSSSYHGRYKKWVGNGWVDIGNNKPDDCFAIEPDGSLEADDSDDAGLEFVSPPTPLEQVPDLMKRVQRWAGLNGAYTGKRNKTSIHTNISVPGYDLDKLDYLKAALLLGDEYVLREFDRIGNTYAAPAIEKVKQLVQQKPEKAQELLDKMSQLNAEASKLIHSGQTNKFTSINTKGNRVEFRSPGGDYLDIIADNPQKMIDTINRMVVTLDAAMDPNKYKQEYQKKLYKVLTGQGGGREAKSGLKQAMKASDKDLLNIFSRYAAGELPRAALKSFVRQAQLERRGKKADAELANHNWAIRRRDSGDIVRTFQADDYTAAHEYLQQYKQKHNITDNSLTYGPYNAGEEKSAQQPSTQFGAARGAPNYAVVRDSDGTVVYRFYADDRSEALGLKHDFVQMQGWGQRDYSLRDESESTPIPGSTLDLQRQRAAAAQGSGQYVVFSPTGREYGSYNTESEARAAAQQIANQNDSMVNIGIGGLRLASIQPQPAQQQQGNWGIWMLGADRFANQPGEYPRGATPPLYRFPSREAAEQWIEQQRAERPRMRTDIEVREIEPREPLPDLFPELPGTPAAQQGSVVNYELYNRLTDEVIDTFPARNDNEAMTRLNDYRQFGAGQSSPDHFGVRRGPGVDTTAQQSAAQTNHNGPWEIFRMEDGRIMGTIPAGFSHRQAEAEIYRRAEAAGYDPEILDVRPARQTPDQSQGGLIDVPIEIPDTAPQTLTVPGQPQQQFTGEWKVVDPNGNEIYRFSGVGNAQSDANRVAMDWLRRNPRHLQAGVEVLPVMG